MIDRDDYLFDPNATPVDPEIAALERALAPLAMRDAAWHDTQRAYLQEDRWYKIVGYVLPQGSANVASGSLGGLYDAATGARIGNNSVTQSTTTGIHGDTYTVTG